jgi:hypothetical protein
MGLGRKTHSDGVRSAGARHAVAAGLGLAGALGVSFVSPVAGADEPRKVTEPNVLREPAEVTQVVDAFDDDDRFDLHLSLGYQHSWKTGKIRRETSINQSGLTTGGYTADSLNVAEYKETTSRLNTRADIGLYRDIALIIRVPIILAHDRELESLEGSAEQQRISLQGFPGEQLFQLPFKSPTRSGVEYLAVGLDFGVMNQARDTTKPSWVIGLEGRFSVAEPMHACNENPTRVNPTAAAQQVKCADPSDINRNGVVDDVRDEFNNLLEGKGGNRDAGVSRGTTALELHTFLSKRIKYIEPYGGFRGLLEFQNEGSDYGQTDFKGSLVNHPPFKGSMILGLNVIPWEVRDQYQRVNFDFRFTGSYVSEGRDYSELFDALGSSDAPSLRMPLYSDYQANPDFDPTTPDPDVPPSVANPNSQKVYFTGLTDVQPHAMLSFTGSFTWQAGEYVKFNVGGGYTLVQPHFITFDQACNPDFSNDLSKAGPCRSTQSGQSRATGIPNPNYRAVINAPGRRFRVDDSNTWDVWLNATVMF